MEAPSAVMLAPRITLNEVAQASGLSRSGVSRALRNDARVPKATCKRVQLIAARLGYRPDPEVSSALRLLRQRQSGRYIETLAFLSWHDGPIEQCGNLYTKWLYYGARRHAEALGYHLDEYWVRAPGMTARRLQSILVNRGVRGCLIGPLTENVTDFAFDLKRFSVVAATTALAHLTMHRARAANFDNTRIALAEVRKLGYRRIGLLVDDYINNRNGDAIQAAYLDHQYTHSDQAAIPILEVIGLGPDPGEECLKSQEYAKFITWYKANLPDVILSSRVVFHSWLRQAGLIAPEHIGFVSLEGVNAGQTLSHIDQHPDRVGAAGIDLLIAVLNHNERGVPSEALSMTVNGTWVEGSSTQSRHIKSKAKKSVVTAPETSR
jgi:LacI family transcriptional regulator